MSPFASLGRFLPSATHAATLSGMLLSLYVQGVMGSYIITEPRRLVPATAPSETLLDILLSSDIVTPTCNHFFIL